jgi:Flp pilus assembly protein TadG
VLDDTGGASAAEFALLAPVFLMMVAGIIELGLVFFASVTLDDATAEAARRLRTGEVQESADPLDLFQTSLCGSLSAVLDCAKVQFDVRGSSDFTSADTSLVLDEEGNPVDTAFAPGDSGEVTVVRVAYRWSFFTPLIGSLMSDNGTDSLLLMSTSVFQNEPYGAPS